MPQIFHRSTNTLAKLSIFGSIFVLLFVTWAVAEINRSSWNTGAFDEREQPVQFSHKHHTGDDGIDCRYCHSTVETTATAGMPPTQTCMNCHSQIWSDSPYLEPVRASFRENKPIEWERVHDLPEYVYFNHSIHVNKGVGCSSCHGDVANMPSVYQENTLQMEWCLSCHRNVENNVRPKSEIYNTSWVNDQTKEEKEALAKQYRLRPSEMLTSCSTCHR